MYVQFLISNYIRSPISITIMYYNCSRLYDEAEHVYKSVNKLILLNASGGANCINSKNFGKYSNLHMKIIWITHRFGVLSVSNYHIGMKSSQKQKL